MRRMKNKFQVDVRSKQPDVLRSMTGGLRVIQKFWFIHTEPQYGISFSRYHRSLHRANSSEGPCFESLHKIIGWLVRFGTIPPNLAICAPHPACLPARLSEICKCNSTHARRLLLRGTRRHRGTRRRRQHRLVRASVPCIFMRFLCPQCPAFWASLFPVFIIITYMTSSRFRRKNGQ